MGLEEGGREIKQSAQGMGTKNCVREMKLTRGAGEMRKDLPERLAHNRDSNERE